MKLLFHYIYGFLFALLAFGAFLEFIAILPFISEDWSIYRWFFVGMLVYMGLMTVTKTVVNQNGKFIRTFTHELTHTIFTFLSFKGIRHFQASSSKGGEIHVVGGSNMMILLSPYCIPIFTVVLLLIKPLLQAKFAPYLEGALGFTYLFHLHTNWLQIGIRQTDITRYPLLTSYAFITLFHILLFCILLFSFKEGVDAFWQIPRETVKRLWFTVLHFTKHPI